MKLPKLLKKCLKQKNLINIMLLIVIIYLLIQAYKKVFEGFNPEKDELVLFHMNGCGHCVNFMPEWDKFSKETQGVLNTRKVEASDDPQAIEKAGVTYASAQPNIATEVSGQIEKEIMRELRLARAFREIQINSQAQVLPIQQDTGLATFQAGAATAGNLQTRGGAAPQPAQVTLKAFRLIFRVI